MYSIGQISQKTGVSPETIRYYERIALLPPPHRADNGYRQYDDADVERLQFIRHSRMFDFGLDEIQEILAFRDRNEPPCQFVMGVMKEHIQEIERRILDLEKLRDELQMLYEAGKHLPEDVEMKQCVCHLIQASSAESK